MDEVTDSAREQLLGMHVYFLRGSQREAHFVAARQVQGAPDADNLTALAVSTLQDTLCMTSAEIASKLVAVATDGASVMAGQHSGVVMRLKLGHAPFAQGIPCYGHRVNLVGAGMENIPIMSKLSQLVALVYGHFANR
jgi:hypothetical protein